MSPLLLAWYKSNIEKDSQEEVENNIAIVEYLASFSNPKAVEHARSARRKPQGTIDAGMLRTLKAISGKHLTDDQIKKSLLQK